ncbi:MAG: MFS transporter [Candidatus Puniceispirillaceae bacterium]
MNSSTAQQSTKKARFGWALFDWASSPVPTLHATFVFAVYFSTTIAPENGTVLWAQMTALTSLLIAISSVFLGRLADSRGLIKGALTTSLLIGSVAVMALWFAEPHQSFILFALLMSALSIFMMEITFVFYNALLVHLVPADKMGRLSGIAWGVGYVGAVVALGLALVIFILPDEAPFGLDKTQAEHIRATMIFAGAWAIFFSLPLFFFVKSPPATPQQGSYLSQVSQAIKDAREIPHMVRFLIARMAFNDGLVTLFALGGIFAAKVFGFTQTEILIFAISLNIAAGLGAIGGGWADDRFGALPAIRYALIGLLIFGIVAICAPTKEIFWGATILLGLFVGPCQSASRSYVARRAPAHSKASLFGLYMLSGKATSFVGPLLYGWLVFATGIERAGMAIVIILILLGYWLLPKHHDQAE